MGLGNSKQQFRRKSSSKSKPRVVVTQSIIRHNSLPTASVHRKKNENKRNSTNSVRLVSEAHHKDVNADKVVKENTTEVLNNIEQTLKKIKDEIGENSTKQVLNSSHEKLRPLQKDLQNLDTSDNTGHEKRKLRLEKELSSLYHKIQDDNNKIQQKAKISKTNTTQKEIEILGRIKTDINSINIENENFEAIRRRFDEYKHILQTIQSTDAAIISEKSLIETKMVEFELEAKITEAEVTVRQYIKNLQTLKRNLGDHKITDKNPFDRQTAVITIIESIIATYNNNCKTPEPNDNQNENPEISKIEQQVEKLKTQIHSFCGLESSDEYFEIDEPLIQLTLKLDGLIFDEDSEVHKKKLVLIRTIKEAQLELDKNLEQTKTIHKIEKEIANILAKGDSSECKSLMEELSRVTPRNDRIKAKKEACETKFKKLSK